MGYTVQKSGESVIIATFTNPFDAAVDGGAVAGHLIDILNNTTGDVYYIADMQGVDVSFSELVEGLAVAFTTPGSPYANPRLQTFTVATDDLLALGTKAVSEQQQYGKANVKLYSSVAEAQTEINRLMGKG